MKSAWLIPTYLLLIACAEQGIEIPHSFRIYEENGIEIAESTGGPKFQGALFEAVKVLEIRPDESNSNALLVRPRDFTKDSDGRFYVFDEGSPRIVVFDSTGQYLRSIGRYGDGPGEFRRPHLQSLNGDILEVFDDIQLRTSRYKLSGELIDVLSLIQPLRRMSALYHVRNDLSIALQFFTRDEDGYSWYQRSCVLLSSSEEILATLQTPWIKGEKIKVARYTAGGSPAYARMDIHYRGSPNIYVTSNSELVISDGETPYLTWYNPSGNQVRRIVLNLPNQSVSREERSIIIRDAKRMNRSRPSNAPKFDWTELIEIRDPKALFRKVDIDYQGYIWLENPRLEDDWVTASHKLLSPAGEYLGDVHFEQSGGLVRSGEYLVIVTDQETGEKIPTVYRIRSIVDGFDYPN